MIVKISVISKKILCVFVIVNNVFQKVYKQRDFNLWHSLCYVSAGSLKTRGM